MSSKAANDRWSQSLCLVTKPPPAPWRWDDCASKAFREAVGSHNIDLGIDSALKLCLLSELATRHLELYLIKQFARRSTHLSQPFKVRRKPEARRSCEGQHASHLPRRRIEDCNSTVEWALLPSTPIVCCTVLVTRLSARFYASVLHTNFPQLRLDGALLSFLVKSCIRNVSNTMLKRIEKENRTLLPNYGWVGKDVIEAELKMGSSVHAHSKLFYWKP